MNAFNFIRPGWSALALSVFLAACGSDSSNNNPYYETDDTADSVTRQTLTPSSGETTTGIVFTKENGLTLYTFENDRNDTDGDGTGDSDCNGGCAETWPPLLASDNAVASGKFSIINRDNGERQWAFKGMPLYNFSGDNQEGDINGEGLGSVWYVARPDPWVVAEVDSTAAGLIFVGFGTVKGLDGNGSQIDDRIQRDGLSLYTFEGDRNDANGDGTGDSDCNDACAETWPPLFADAGATAGGPFTIIERDDNSKQWALNGMPLYFFSNDLNPGDTLGEGAGDAFFVARPNPIQVSDSLIGTIFSTATSTIGVNGNGAPNDTTDRTNRVGFSLYTFDGDRNDTDGDGLGDSDCNDACAEVWPPLFADDGATPTGNFSLITRDDGFKQWAFKEEPLYFFSSDTAPGDVNGDQARDAFHVARPAPVQLVTDPNLGEIFTAKGLINDIDNNGQQADTLSDKTGFTVYRFDNDTNDVDGDGALDSDCNNDCAVTWPPLYATANDVAAGDFTIIDREDGSRQWAYQNSPLYFFSGDTTVGDVNGVYGTWHEVNP